MRLLIAAALSLLVIVPIHGQGQATSAGVSSSQRELGLVVLRGLSITESTVSFTVDSGGCTTKESFTVRVAKDGSLVAGKPHYRLSIERTVADDCKALLLEGVDIELDIRRDLGITGPCTLTVENPVLAQPGAGA